MRFAVEVILQREFFIAVVFLGIVIMMDLEPSGRKVGC